MKNLVDLKKMIISMMVHEDIDASILVGKKDFNLAYSDYIENWVD